MSLIPGELDHFVVAVISAEKEWRTWYNNPFREQVPKIEMEIEKSSSKSLADSFFTKKSLTKMNFVT